MKYNVLTPIHAFVRLGVEKLLDFNDAAVLSFLWDFQQSGNVQKHTEKGREYFWFSHDYICSQLPMLPSKSRSSMIRLFDRLEEAGFITHCPSNQSLKRAYYGFTPKMSALFNDEYFDNEVHTSDCVKSGIVSLKMVTSLDYVRNDTLTMSKMTEDTTIKDKTIRTTGQAPSGLARSVRPARIASATKTRGSLELANTIGKKLGMATSYKSELAERLPLKDVNATQKMLTAFYECFSTYTPQSIDEELKEAVEWLVRNRKRKPKRDQLLSLVEWLLDQSYRTTSTLIHNSKPTLPSDEERRHSALVLCKIWDPTNPCVSSID